MGKGRWSDDPLLLWGKRSIPWWSEVFFGGGKVRKYLFPVYPSRVAFHGQHGDPLSQCALIGVVFIITCIEIPTSQTLHAWDFSTAGSTKSIEIAPTKLQNEDLQLVGKGTIKAKPLKLNICWSFDIIIGGLFLQIWEKSWTLQKKHNAVSSCFGVW